MPAVCRPATLFPRTPFQILDCYSTLSSNESFQQSLILRGYPASSLLSRTVRRLIGVIAISAHRFDLTPNSGHPQRE